MPFDDKAEKVLRYECDSRDEYVGISIDSYLMRIRCSYKTSISKMNQFWGIVYYDNNIAAPPDIP